MFLKMPFRDSFREPSGTRCFLLIGTTSDGKVTKKTHKEKLGRQAGVRCKQGGRIGSLGHCSPIMTFLHFPFRIPFRPASGQPGDYFYENYVSTHSTAPWLLGSIPRARSVQAISLSHSTLLLASSPFSLSLFVSVRNSFWNRAHDIYNSPSGIPSGIPYFPFREASGTACF